MTTISVEKHIKTTPEQAYLALTRASLLTQWLCDLATVAPHPGGRMYLWWNGDFYSSGEYVSLEENKSVSFKWFGRSDPGPSQVNISLTGKDGGTLVTLAHSVPEGTEWKDVVAYFQNEWARSLENLASVLETGKDLRIWNRPLIGISGFSDFNAEIARQMGVPVNEGVRLDNLIEGMGAHKAGLQKNDVIVQVAGKPITNDFSTFAIAMQGKKGGDVVEVVYYRGSEKMTIQMELTKRPEPNIPWDAKELGKAARAKYDEALAALEKALQGVSESDAEYKPALGEWSAKETLAHLIHTERFWAFNLVDSVNGFNRWADDGGGNIEAHIQATVAAYPTIPALLSELKANITEVVTFASNLPDSFLACKSAYLNNANVLLNLQSHLLSHIEQIKSAVEAARKK